MESASDFTEVRPHRLSSRSLLKSCTLHLVSTYKSIRRRMKSKNDLKKGEILEGKYIFLKHIGRGSFGRVVKAQHMHTNEIVAIKIIENASSYQRHALQEIKTLTEIENFDSNNGFIVKMLEYFYWGDSICIVFELLHKNLYQLIKESGFQGMSLANVRVFAWQILMALRLLEVPELRIVHCDLKPENIMLVTSDKAGIKLIDFGSACKKTGKCRYIQSRYYRAPEVLLDLPFDASIDMWSIGCILAELLTGKPLFPGTSDKDQLITKKIGPLPCENLSCDTSKLSHRVEGYFSSSGQYEDANFGNFIDLLSKIFVYKPLMRLNPKEALNHPFFTEVKICVKENRLRLSCCSQNRSTASSIDSSPSPKLSTEISTGLLLSPTRQGSYTAQEELLFRNIGGIPTRRTSLQDNEDFGVLFTRTRK